MYYGRIEAYYEGVVDLLSTSARHLMNLVLHWMQEHHDAEAWREERRDENGSLIGPSYHDVFYGQPDLIQRQQESRAKLAPAQKGQQGSLNIAPREKPAQAVTDISQFLGRAGATGKADPNKAVIAEKARKTGKPVTKITIAQDDEGGVTFTEPDTP
jgi:hypothetical protein